MSYESLGRRTQRQFRQLTLPLPNTTTGKTFRGSFRKYDGFVTISGADRHLLNPLDVIQYNNQSYLVTDIPEQFTTGLLSYPATQIAFCASLLQPSGTTFNIVNPSLPVCVHSSHWYVPATTVHTVHQGELLEHPDGSRYHIQAIEFSNVYMKHLIVNRLP